MTDVFDKCPIKEEYKPEFKKNYGGWGVNAKNYCNRIFKKPLGINNLTN